MCGILRTILKRANKMEDIIKKSLSYTLIIKIFFIVCITFSACFFREIRILVWYLIVPFVGIGFKVAPVEEVEHDSSQT